jgi:hypothetical protein
MNMSPRHRLTMAVLESLLIGECPGVTVVNGPLPVEPTYGEHFSAVVIRVAGSVSTDLVPQEFTIQVRSGWRCY